MNHTFHKYYMIKLPYTHMGTRMHGSTQSNTHTHCSTVCTHTPLHMCILHRYHKPHTQCPLNGPHKVKCCICLSLCVINVTSVPRLPIFCMKRSLTSSQALCLGTFVVKESISILLKGRPKYPALSKHIRVRAST